MTLGVEGTGHHMIETISPTMCKSCPQSVCIGKAQPRTSLSLCGGRASFPASHWHHKHMNHDELLQLDRKLCDRLLGLNSASGRRAKFLVLLRDPLETLKSYLRRFWNGTHVPSGPGLKLAPDPDMLLVEHYRLGWVHFDKCVRRVPCEHSLFLSYELLTAYPSWHMPPLAAFFGVPPHNPELRSWLGRLRPSGAHPSPKLHAERVVAPYAAECANLSRGGEELSTKLAAHSSASSLTASGSSAPAGGWREHCQEGPATSNATQLRCLRAWHDAAKSRLDAAELKLDVFPAHTMSLPPCRAKEEGV